MLQWFLGVCYKGISSMLKTCFCDGLLDKNVQCGGFFCYKERHTLLCFAAIKNGLVAHIAFVLLHENSQMSTYFLSKFINPWKKCSKKCC
jgi:hypothetical protein